MSQFGNNTNSEYAYGWPGAGWGGGSLFTMPQAGLITDVWAYFDTIQGNGAHGWACVWDASGNLLTSVDLGIINNGTQNWTYGSQAWWHGTFPTALFVAGGVNVYLGSYSNQGYLYGASSGGSNTIKSMGTSGPGSLAGGVSSGVGYANGTMMVYANYTPSGIKVRRGAGWTEAPLKVRRGGGWTAVPGLKVRRAGGWTVTP